MIAFKGITQAKTGFLYSQEASGSDTWNVDLLSTVDHAGTSPRESTSVSAPPPKIDKEL